MDKQELIEKLKGHGAWCTECHDINGEKDRYVKVAKVRELLEQLDEPQKVKVPECVGELLDYYRKSADVDLLALLICFKDWYFRNDKTSESEEAIDWLVKHPEKFMKAWIDGYEVEEEPKYFVELKTLDRSYFLIQNLTVFGEIHTQLNEARENPYAKKWKSTFTEKEIKAMDERYWPFAVPVEKV